MNSDHDFRAMLRRLAAREVMMRDLCAETGMSPDKLRKRLDRALDAEARKPGWAGNAVAVWRAGHG